MRPKDEDTCLGEHGHGATRRVRLFYGERDYPAKAILGVAHGCEFPAQGPLRAADFSSGDSTVAKLKPLGFQARSVEDTERSLRG